MSDYNNHREEVFSKSVRAGKRTYFFDVKSTKSNEYYLTITESKKRLGDDGNPFFEKHKIFLYREDFEKFMDGIREAMERIQTLQPVAPTYSSGQRESGGSGSYGDVDFDDLGK
ncbi:MAG: hypothetical protein RL213_1754 [Bacteroidota bacterium]|jgi:hypothetical protein